MKNMEDLGKLLFDRIQDIRSAKSGKIELGDIDGIIAGIMETMKGYVSSATDITIYNEIEKISKQIKQAKQEVQDLNPRNIADSFIPGATSELSAVTQATEQSTNTILDAAEFIQNIAGKLENKVAGQEISNKIITIFEACNFQDITGQRISKVIKILEDIDSTVSTLINAFSDKYSGTKKVKNVDGAAELLNGPQLDGQAPSQSQIDDIFNNMSGS